MGVKRFRFWVRPALQFRLFGFPLAIAWSTLLFAVVPLVQLAIGTRDALTPALIPVWLGVVVLSILVHELGHAFAARRYALEPVSVTVHGIGGYCEHRGGGSHAQKLVVALAGPAAGVGLGLLAYLVGQAVDVRTVEPTGMLEYFRWGLVYVAVLWSGLNLLPVRPLDGGAALTAILHMTTPATAMPIAWAVGFVTAAVGAIVALLLPTPEPFIAVMGVLFAYHNGRSLWRWYRADAARPRKG